MFFDTNEDLDAKKSNESGKNEDFVKYHFYNSSKIDTRDAEDRLFLERKNITLKKIM